jgi:ribosome biogenesis GTPase
MTTPHAIPTRIVVNKADLYDDEDLEIIGGLGVIYQNIGYPVHLASAVSHDGIDELKAVLKDKTTLVSGHSGVGKSTLINAIQKGLQLRTQEISDYSGKGQHTTTFAEMFPLDFGGYIIDTPGIKELSFNNMEPIDIAHNFVEFFEASRDCKVHDCLHLNEPSCAVKTGIEEGTISSLRYENYLRIMADIKEQNYWERKTDW